MTHPHLRVETDGPVRSITLDHPEKRNAQTPSMWAALADEARSLPEEVRVVVLRGAGDAFSAGIDTAMFTPEGVPGEESVAQLAAGGPEATQRGIAAYQEGFTASGECATVNWAFLGLSMPAWVFVWFVALGALAVVANWTRLSR